MKRHNLTSLVVTALAVSLAACSSLRDGMEGHRNIVASAAGFPLTIETAAELTAASFPQSVLPNAALVDKTANLWVSCVLLITEFASPDGFSDIDVQPQVENAVAQATIMQLHGQVIVALVDSSDAVLRSAYEREQPFVRVEAYHILISTSGATEAELDSLRQVADAIRERAAGGEDFGQLARQYSDDPTSAPQGGYLGWVDRGRLLTYVDDALFAMQPGEVSETVRSVFGYHIFKVTDRDSPDFEAARDAYRRNYVRRRVAELGIAYVDSLLEANDIVIVEGATKLVNRLARSMRYRRLSTVSRSAVLVRYRGGAFTVDDWTAALNGERGPVPQDFAGSDSATIHGLLIEMVQDKLLLKVATDLGHTISEDQYNSYVQAAYDELRGAARRLELNRQDLVGSDEAIANAAQRAVRDAIENRYESALHRAAKFLRQTHNFRVYADRLPAVVDRAVAIRQEQS